MLEEYIPDDAPDYYHGHPNRHRHYFEDIVFDHVIVKRGTLQKATYDMKYYKPENAPAVLAAPPIIDGRDGINWDSPFGNERITDTWPTYSTAPTEVSPYNRVRGKFAHHYILGDIDPGDASDVATEDLTPSDWQTIEELQEAVGNWEGAPEVSPPEQEYAYDDSRTALMKRMGMEVRTSYQNWKVVVEEAGFDLPLAIEQQLIANVDEIPFGVEIDHVAVAEGGSIPDGLYSTELKIAGEIRAPHIIQSEVQRRALYHNGLGKLPEAAVVRLGTTDGDYEIVTSQDDSWYADDAWTLFRERAEWLLNPENTNIAIALQQVDPR